MKQCKPRQNVGFDGLRSEGLMSKEEMKAYIVEKLGQADYLEVETVYGLVLGLMG